MKWPRHPLPLILLLIQGCFSAPAYSGPETDHFDGEHFENQVPFNELGFGGVMHWWFTVKRPRWPAEVVDPPAPKPVDAWGQVRCG